jgi:hypothetical protein
MAWKRRSCSINPATVTAERNSAEAPEEDAGRSFPADERSDGLLEGPSAWANSETATTASAASTSAMRSQILTVWLVCEFTLMPMYHGGSNGPPFAAAFLGAFGHRTGRE